MPEPDPLPTDDLPLRPDFDSRRREMRRNARYHAMALRTCLTILSESVRRQDDREAVADALDSLRGVFAALRDVGTVDPHAADDPDGTRTVVTLGDMLPE